MRHLFFAGTQLETVTSIYILATTHSLLVRYPHVRINLKALVPAGFSQVDQLDDAKVDFAMAALRSETHSNLFEDGNRCGDGSWALSLLARHPDPRYQRILAALLSRDVVHVPLNISTVTHALEQSPEKFCGKFDTLFDQIPPKRTRAKQTPTMKKQSFSMKVSKKDKRKNSRA